MRLQSTMKRKLFGSTVVAIFASLLSSFSLFAQPVDPIDLCMRLPDPLTNEVEIVMRPTTNLLATENITEIRFTIWWQQPLLTVIPDPEINPFNVEPVPGGPVPYGGYYYQTFQTLSDELLGFPVSAGEEVVIATFTVSAPLWSFIYLSDNAYIMDHNLQYYYELDGGDRTGVIYCDSVQITPDLTVPLSNWPIYLSLLLMAGVIIVFMFRKLW